MKKKKIRKKIKKIKIRKKIYKKKAQDKQTNKAIFEKSNISRIPKTGDQKIEILKISLKKQVKLFSSFSKVQKLFFLFI